jgi:hypothetical protein
MSGEQARWFALARHAEEPFGQYPLWIPEAEYALCRWGQRAADATIFQSLIAAASIETWPVSPSERAHWTEIKKKHGRYCLAARPRYPMSTLLPDLDRVLAACVVSLQDQGLSWITANRILKRRLDAHVSAGLLAVLVALGALIPPDHWQLRHRPGPRLQDMISALGSAMRESSLLTWTSPLGIRLSNGIGALEKKFSRGWLSQPTVTDLITAVSGGAAEPLPVEDDADESAASFEELLREARSSFPKFESYQAALSSLKDHV